MARKPLDQELTIKLAAAKRGFLPATDLTIREYLTGQAIAGLLAHGDGPNTRWSEHPPSLAQFALDIADAVLIEQTKEDFN